MFQFDEAINAAAEAAPHEAAPVPMVPGLQLHIDGDYIAYFASGNEDTTPGEARLNAISLIEDFRSRTGAERVIMHNTAAGCHKGERYLVATVKPYQAQRVGDAKPKNHAYLQNWLTSYDGPLFQTKNWTTREADDGIGACAHFALGGDPGYIAIATADKDLRMLPGLHIDWSTRKLVRVNAGDYDVVGEEYPGIKAGEVIMKPGKQYGLKFFFVQMLMGDATDNIPGLPEFRSTDAKGKLVYKKLGEKTAYALLEDCHDAVSAAKQVLDLYYESYHRDTSWTTRSTGIHTEYADRYVEQAALLWMRCELNAPVADFIAHRGASYIAYPEAIHEAAVRLEERVHIARSEINALADSVDPLSTISLAA